MQNTIPLGMLMNGRGNMDGSYLVIVKIFVVRNAVTNIGRSRKANNAAVNGAKRPFRRSWLEFPFSLEDNAMPEQKDEICPDCGRIKARNAAGCGMGYCPKWYAIRDEDAERDCDRVRHMKDGLHCLWSRADHDSDCWETSCDQAFCLTDGTPKENDFKFCAYCGKPLIEDSDCVSAE